MFCWESDWRLPAHNLLVASKDVHVWRASLKQPSMTVHNLAQTLSKTESAKADSFYFKADQRRFIVGRGILRQLLSFYLDIEPQQLMFRYSSNGKPYLDGEFDASKLRFNLSHSNELALYAFTAGREVGVDLEYLRSLPDMENIAARFFSERENTDLRALPEHDRLLAFFTCWTRKEAFLKATGEGLSYPLKHFDVSLTPGEPPKLLHVKEDPQAPARWSLRDLKPAPQYVGTVVAEGKDWHITRFQWHRSRIRAANS
ncbi:MAG: 4'-phosphopantetheinyl transferase superfamily protein [Chloroflexi bacterium]|jgi:4'-phosphopantetheinyl transferase|nr:4'-phosphopantetheinyl transferase superfamily protein [Chloroflexota bacterium]